VGVHSTQGLVHRVPKAALVFFWREVRSWQPRNRIRREGLPPAGEGEGELQDLLRELLDKLDQAREDNARLGEKIERLEYELISRPPAPVEQPPAGEGEGEGAAGDVVEQPLTALPAVEQPQPAYAVLGKPDE